jgi:hypothetical protein
MATAVSGMSCSLLRSCVNSMDAYSGRPQGNIEIKIDRILMLPAVFYGYGTWSNIFEGRTLIDVDCM